MCLVSQSCPTLCNLMDCSLPGSFVHGDSLGKNTGVGSHALLQGIFPTQGSNPGLPHCRHILYQLSHKGSPRILEWVVYPFSRRFSWPRNWTGVSCIASGFFTNWALREAMRDIYECSNYHTSAFISHDSKVMFKILQARLQQYVNWEFPDVQTGFRKGRGTRDQTANIRWIIEKPREFQKNIHFCFIDYAKAFDCVNHNKLWKILKEMGIPGHLTCLLRNLYAGQ